MKAEEGSHHPFRLLLPHERGARVEDVVLGEDEGEEEGEAEDEGDDEVDVDREPPALDGPG